MRDDAERCLQAQVENLYGHKRKIAFILRALDEWVSVNGRVPRVLDVGCGTGAVVTRHVAAAGYPVLGIDTDRGSIDEARLRFAKGELEFRCEPLSAVAGTFDVIMMIEVIEHLSQPVELLQLARRKLADDGWLIVTVPNGYGPFELEKWLWRTLRMDRFWTNGLARRLKGLAAGVRGEAAAGTAQVVNSLDESPHLQFFTRGKIVRLLADAGFALLRTGKSSVLAGPFSDSFLPKWSWLMRLNSAAGSFVPRWLVNGHYYLSAVAPQAGKPSDAR